MHELAQELGRQFVLVAALLGYSGEYIPYQAHYCFARYEIPAPVMMRAEEEWRGGGSIEIREQTWNGYIHTLYYGHLYLEGVFFRKGDDLVACGISFVKREKEYGAFKWEWQQTM
ncbi:MAG: hypothetical protein KGH56_03260 [Patescibacteria group bacterium]|nr:hypothetical protein [Patescibacteria group bacterium]